MPRKPGPERRAHPRAFAPFVLEVFEPEGRLLAGIARLLNLSVQGACVESTSHLPDRARYILRLILEDNSLLDLSSEVLWRRPFAHVTEYGFKFDPYPVPDQDRVMGFVKKYFSSEK